MTHRLNLERSAGSRVQKLSAGDHGTKKGGSILIGSSNLGAVTTRTSLTDLPRSMGSSLPRCDLGSPPGRVGIAARELGPRRPSGYDRTIEQGWEPRCE